MSMSISIQSPTQFDVNIDGGRSNGNRWTQWVRRFNVYIAALGITTDTQKIAILLHVAGERVEEIYNVKRDTAILAENEKLVDILAIFEKHFQPQTNTEMETIQFRQMAQRQGEGIDPYIIRLKTQAALCGFATSLETQIKLQIIQGCIDKRIKIKSAQETCTLDQLVKYAQSLEYSNDVMNNASYTKSLGSVKMEQVNQVKHEQKNKFNRSWSNNKNNKSDKNKCYSCGYDYPHQGTCPAKGKTCNKCNKIGHFTSVCRSKTNTKPKSNIEGVNQLIQHSQNIQQENTISKTNTNTDTYSLFAINSSKADCPRIMVNILGSTINMGVDSQASINALTRKTYENMAIKPQLKTENSISYSADGVQPMKSLGIFEAYVEARNISIKTTFHVFENLRDDLLCYQTSIDLKLINITYMVNTKNDADNKQIITTYPQLFSGKIGKLKDYELELHINKEVKPIASKARRIPAHLHQPVENALKKMLEDDIIEKVINEPTPWISEMVIVPKPSNPKEVRITIDAKAVNMALERERHYMPTIEELALDLSGAKYMSKLDLKGGFHQIVLHEKSRYISCFRTPLGIMRNKRLIQGFKSSQEIFQNIIHNVIADIENSRNLVDDIFVWGSSYEDANKTLHTVLKRLQDAGLTLSPDKCVFNTTELEFFGMKFTQEGIALTDSKIRAIKDTKLPTTQSELRSFLGLATFCTRSIPKLQIICKPLWHMTRIKIKNNGERNKTRDCKLQWTDEQIKQFDLVKESVISTPLGYFNRDWKTCLEVDASPVGVGSVLYQHNPENIQDVKVISYWSQGLSDVESRYSQYEKEALAVVLACEKHELYLIGSSFTLYTDNKAVEMIYRNPLSTPSARIRRFNLRLSPFDFKIIHKPGKDNIADYLSRHPVETVDTERQTWLAEQYIHFIASNNIPRAISLEEFVIHTKSDTILTKLIRAIERNNYTDTDVKPYKRYSNELSVYNSSIILRGDRIVVPHNLKTRICELAHEGHLGIEKTKRLIRERVWFSGIDKMVEQMIKQCKACQLTSNGNHPNPIRSTECPNQPWKQLAIDFHGPLANGHELMVIIDEHSKFPIVVEVTTTASQYVIPKLDNLFSLMGIPETLKSDNGPPFQGIEFKMFMNEYGIKHRKITPEHPQSNGQVENFNKNLKRLIQKSFINNSDWNKELNSFLRAYRNTPHSSTSVAPADLLFINSNSSKLPPKINTNIHEQTIQERQTKAIMNDNKNKAYMKAYTDTKRRAKEHNFQIGDKVLINQLLNKKIYSKLKSKFADRDLIITEIKGSMITVKDTNGYLCTRDSSLFKRAPDEYIENIELEYTPNIQENQQHINPPIEINIDQDPLNENVNIQEHLIQNPHREIENRMDNNVAENVVIGNRQSTRLRRRTDFFKAGPASGKINGKRF